MSNIGKLYGRRTTILLTNDIASKVDDTAKKLGFSNSDFIRQAIANYLKEWGGI